MSHASSPAIDLGGLAPSLGETCSGYLGNYRAKFEEAVRNGALGVPTAANHARALDGLLSSLYCAADAVARGGGREPKGRISLVAVGGYGRNTLGLYSDVDVMLLCDDPNDPFAGALAEGLLYPLWDLGVDIGHVVRGIDDTLTLALDDIRTATTLIDLRRVAGNWTIIDDLERAAQERVFRPSLDSFLDALESDTKARHKRFGESLFLLEPEVKQGRGGLRDLDVAEWAARARWGARTTQDYVRTGALLAREVRELEDAREMLWRVRNLLHLRAGRQQDRLTFDDQEDIAQELGFVDGISLGVEQFMQAYYRHARIVAMTAERMVDRARPRHQLRATSLRKLGNGILVVDETVTLDDPSRIEQDPALALRFYRQAIRHDKKPHYQARDAIARTAPDKRWRLRLQDSEEATQLFLWLITQLGRGAFPHGSIISELYDIGLLAAMIPEFEPLIGRVYHDVFHVYTADVHAVKALRHLRELARGETSGTPLAARLAAEAPRRTPLFLAVLLHSIGRSRGKHADEEGARIAKGIAERLGLDEMDIEHVHWLIAHQWTLYRFATQRDVHDPEAIAELARMVQTPERLRDLFLCTVAIVSTVNPKAMTSWKAQALEDLYLALHAHLEGGSESTTAEKRVVEVKLQVVVGFAGDVGQDQLHAFLDEMPQRYFLANPVDVIRRHARVARDSEGHTCFVRVSAGPSDDVDEVVVIAPDQSGVLVDVTAALSAHELDVLAAEIYTRKRSDRGSVFDVFLVRARPRTDRNKLAQALQNDLQERFDDRISAADLMRRRPSQPAWAIRSGPDVRTHVSVDNDASSRFTVIDVFTRDRIGLLHEIARTIHQLGLEVALSKVNTEGDRVADVFYVTNEAGKKIRDPDTLKFVRDKLHQRVVTFHDNAEMDS